MNNFPLLNNSDVKNELHNERENSRNDSRKRSLNADITVSLRCQCCSKVISCNIILCGLSVEHEALHIIISCSNTVHFIHNAYEPLVYTVHVCNIIIRK